MPPCWAITSLTEIFSSLLSPSPSAFPCNCPFASVPLATPESWVLFVLWPPPVCPTLSGAPHCPPPPPPPLRPLPGGTWHVLPENPFTHRHRNELTRSTQRPPFRQGAPAQSSRLAEQKRPEKPGGHRQEKRFTPSTQVAPLAQGCRRQSSTLVSQRGPVKPARQRHFSTAEKPERSSHRPPFLHGDLGEEERKYIRI